MAVDRDAATDQKWAAAQAAGRQVDRCSREVSRLERELAAARSALSRASIEADALYAEAEADRG